MIGNLSHEAIEEVLSQNLVGRLGCCFNDEMYVVPINYVYDNGSIIAHATEGRKIQIMRKNPKVCLQVDEIINYTHWRSVIAWGEYEELTEEAERYAAMNLFVEKTLHLKVSETAVLPEIHEKRIHPRSPGVIKPVIYRIRLTKKTGRYETTT